MKQVLLQRSGLVMSIAALLATIGIGIYMARPWGHNYAYQSIWGYFGLVIFLGWACSPYLFLSRQFRHAIDSLFIAITRLVESLIICVGGIFILIDTAFIHIDAQGGLIFLFLPLYQWVLIGVFFLIELAVGKLIAYKKH